LTIWKNYHGTCCPQETGIRQQAVDELPEERIFRISWEHHAAMINLPVLKPGQNDISWSENVTRGALIQPNSRFQYSPLWHIFCLQA
jgi:hypothetical protein